MKFVVVEDKQIKGFGLAGDKELSALKGNKIVTQMTQIVNHRTVR